MAGNKYLKFGASGFPEEQAATQTSAGAGDAGKIPALDAAGRFASTMMPAGFGAETKDIVTSEALSAGDFVNVWNSTGIKVRKADATSLAKRAHGYVLAAFGSGATATIYYGNLNNAVSGLTVGATLFLSETVPGSVQETVPAGPNIAQVLGVATTATEMLVEIQPPIQLAA